MPNELPPDSILPGFGDGPPPDEKVDSREMRRYCLRLIREITGRLGWKYKLWIPAAMVLSAVHLLPPRFMLFFTEGTQTLSETGADEFLRLLVIFGIAVAVTQWVGLIFDNILSQWLRLTISIGLKMPLTR